MPNGLTLLRLEIRPLPVPFRHLFVLSGILPIFDCCRSVSFRGGLMASEEALSGAASIRFDNS